VKKREIGDPGKQRRLRGQKKPTKIARSLTIECLYVPNVDEMKAEMKEEVRKKSNSRKSKP